MLSLKPRRVRERLGPIAADLARNCWFGAERKRKATKRNGRHSGDNRNRQECGRADAYALENVAWTLEGRDR